MDRPVENKSPELDLNVYGNVVYDKGGNQITGIRTGFLVTDVGTTG